MGKTHAAECRLQQARFWRGELDKFKAIKAERVFEQIGCCGVGHQGLSTGYAGIIQRLDGLLEHL